MDSEPPKSMDRSKGDLQVDLQSSTCERASCTSSVIRTQVRRFQSLVCLQAPSPAPHWPCSPDHKLLAASYRRGSCCATTTMNMLGNLVTSNENVRTVFNLGQTIAHGSMRTVIRRATALQSVGEAVESGQVYACKSIPKTYMVNHPKRLLRIKDQIFRVRLLVV